MHVLHAIHDFPPRHRAGSELYALELARAQAARHHVTVLCADYDPTRTHGLVSWRLYQGLPVVELVNNWVCDSFGAPAVKSMAQDADEWDPVYRQLARRGSGVAK